MILQMLEQFKKYLRTSGYKATKARIAVFSTLQKHDPATIPEVIEQASRYADRASVYRALNLLRKLGVIKDVVIAGRRMLELTDRFDSHHHHLTCTNCGRSLVIASPAIETALTTVASKHGYRVTGHQIELSGLCPSCH